jgi:hypothetical protein
MWWRVFDRAAVIIGIVLLAYMAHRIDRIERASMYAPDVCGSSEGSACWIRSSPHRPLAVESFGR